MKITDQQLSAFLDAELPENEMELVRNGIEADEGLAVRLAELAMVDEKVVAAYQPLEQRPIPQGVTDLFTKHKALRDTQQTAQTQPRKNNVVQLSLWKKASQHIQQHAAAAAIVCVLIGYGFGQFGGTDVAAQTWQDTNFALDKHTSGDSYIAQSGDIITPKASFMNQQGQYCRQYLVAGETQQQVNLACKKEGQWQLKASIYQPTDQMQSYQTATAMPVLDQMIDQMIVGTLLNRDAEKDVINQNWQSK